MSNSICVSIGMQCATASYLKEKGMRNCSFPFDWILAPPSFIYEMLSLLLEENTYPIVLVSNYFYVLDKKVGIDLNNVEHYFSVSDPNMPNKLNSKYNVIFPHDYALDQNEVKRKYARRFQRLKDFILNKNISMKFFYTSPSSPTKGNFTIDGKEVVIDVFNNLLKIYNLISKYHGNNFNFHIYDTFCVEDPSLYFGDIQNIHIHKLEKKDKFFELIPQMKTFDV
jgi:hypothetical protein